MNLKNIAGKKLAKLREGAESLKNAAESAVEAAGDTVRDYTTKRAVDGLPDALSYFLDNDTARLFLADSLSGAFTAADEDTTWDEILKAALVELQATPAGKSHG